MLRTIARKIVSAFSRLYYKYFYSEDKLAITMNGKEPAVSIEMTDNLDPLFFHIQKVWQNLGESEPFWSVLSADNFKSKKIEKNKKVFYDSGSTDVETLFRTLERNGIDHTQLKACLEFGSGLGRVTRWLSPRFDHVLGYDISVSHIRLAEEYIQKLNIKNISFSQIVGPQDIKNLPKVDLVYSVIVLQHNPPPIIRLIIQELIRALKKGGIAFFQVPTYRLGYKFSLKDYLEKEVEGDHIEMHLLPQHEIFDIISMENAKVIEVLDDAWAGLRKGDRSNTFIIQKL